MEKRRVFSRYFIILVLIFSYNSQALADKPVIQTVTYTWKKNDASASFQLPYISDIELQKELNYRIQCVARSLFQEEVIISQDSTAFQAFFEHLYLHHKNHDLNPFTFYIGTEILMSSPDLISMRVDLEAYYEGAAHPNTTGFFITLNPKKKVFLSPLDLFEQKKKIEIVSKIHRMLEKEAQERFPEPSSFLNIPSSKELLTGTFKNNFGISDNKIIFEAWPMMIGPYAAGNFSLTYSINHQMKKLNKGIK